MSDACGQDPVPEQRVDGGALAVGGAAEEDHLHVIPAQHLLDALHAALALGNLLGVLGGHRAAGAAGGAVKEPEGGKCRLNWSKVAATLQD